MTKHSRWPPAAACGVLSVTLRISVNRSFQKFFIGRTWPLRQFRTAETISVILTLKHRATISVFVTLMLANFNIKNRVSMGESRMRTFKTRDRCVLCQRGRGGRRSRWFLNLLHTCVSDTAASSLWRRACEVFRKSRAWARFTERPGRGTGSGFVASSYDARR